MRRGEVSPRRGEIDRGVDTLDGLEQQPEHLIPVVHVGDHVGGIDACEGLVVRIFQLRRRTYGQRRADGLDVGLQLLLQLGRNRRTDEFREYLLVRELLRNDVFEAVEADEVVEIVRGDDHRAGDHDAHVGVLVVEPVLEDHRIHEGQPAGLAAERALADACEGHRVAVSFRVETRHYALAEQRAVILDEVDDALAMFLGRSELALVAPADRRCQREQPPGIEPFRKVVLRRVIFECLVGDRGDHLLHLHQVFGLADDGTRVGVFEEEFAEGKLLVDIFVQLREQRFGILGDEPRSELAGLYLELGLRRLQQDGHQRVVGLDAAAEVDARVAFLALGRVVAVQHEPYVGDHAQDVLLVTVVEFHGLLVIGGQQDFRPGTLAQNLLLLVEGVLEEFGVLQQDQLVELGQVGRVEAYRVLDEQDGLHAAVGDVLLGVHFILDQLDDGHDQVGIAVPAEDVVEPRAILLLQTAVDVLREGGEQRDRDLGVAFLDDLGKREYVQLPDVVHRQDEVERVVAAEQLQRFACGAHARERRRVRHVQVEVFLVDLRFDVSVLLEDIPVVAAADQQDLVDSVFHEPVLGLVPVRQVFFEILVHRDFVYFNKNRKKSPTGKKKFPDGR